MIPYPGTPYPGTLLSRCGSMVTPQKQLFVERDIGIGDLTKATELFLSDVHAAHGAQAKLLEALVLAGNI